MYKNILTIGLNDKDTQNQIINTPEAKRMIAKTLINQYNVFAFTIIDCAGVYKMNSTGDIVQEASLRVEIATEEPMKEIDSIIDELKTVLNQESIMHEVSTAYIYFK